MREVLLNVSRRLQAILRLDERDDVCSDAEDSKGKKRGSDDEGEGGERVQKVQRRV